MTYPEHHSDPVHPDHASAAGDAAEEWAFDAADPRHTGTRYETAETEALTTDDDTAADPPRCRAASTDPAVRAHAGARQEEQLDCTQTAGHTDHGQHLSSTGTAWAEQTEHTERGQHAGHNHTTQPATEDTDELDARPPTGREHDLGDDLCDD